MFAVPFSKDSARIESIQKEMVECMTTLNNRTNYNSDAHLKKTIRAAKRLDELANSYYSITNDSAVFVCSFMGELITAAAYNSHSMIDSAYVHSQKAYELYEPYGRFLCLSDSTGRWSVAIFGNDGIYSIMREWNVNKGNLNEAIKYGTIIADSCKAINADIEVVKSYLRLGEIYKIKENYKKSIELQIQALDTRLACANYGQLPLASQIYVGILNTIEELTNKEKLLVNKESIEWIYSDSDFFAFLDTFIKSHPIGFCEEEEKLGKTFGVKQLLYTYIRLVEKFSKAYDAILPFEEGLANFIIRNYGKESTEYAEHLIEYSDIYTRYLNELDSDIEKEKYRIIADEKQKQAIEIWNRYFEQNPIEVFASNYLKTKREIASQNQKKEETAEEEVRLHSILSSYINYMIHIYSSSLQLENYDAAYDAMVKTINLEEDVLKNVSPNSYSILGHVSIMRNDYENAEKYFAKSYSLAYNKKDTLNMAGANLSLYKLYAYPYNNQVKAREKLSDTYKMLTEYSYHSIEKAELLEAMANFYKSINNDVIAYSLIELSLIEKKYCGQTLADEDYLKEASFMTGELLLNDSVILLHIQEIADKDIVSEQVQKASELLGGSYASSLTDFEKGIHYYQKAANIAHELKDSIREAKDIGAVGEILFAQKKYDVALKYMLKAEKVNPSLKFTPLLTLLTHIPNDSIVNTRLPFLYEITTKWLKKQLLSTNSEGREMLVRQMEYDVLKSMTYYYPNLPICAEIAYNSTLLYKGLLQNTQKTVSEYIANSNDSNLKKQYDKLQIIRGKEGLRESTLKSTENKIEISELEFSILENLSKKKVLADLEITWDDVRKKLGKNDVAIEFIEINKQECFDRSAFCYGALLLRKEYDAPLFVLLDNKETIDQLIELITYSHNKGVKMNNKNWGNLSRQLYVSLWRKLENNLKEGDNIYFSLDGLLHKAPIELLSDSIGNLANEKYNLFRLSSTRELCKIRKKSFSNVVLYGGLLYDASPNGLEVDSIDAFHHHDDSSLRAKWNYLPASEAEVDSISVILTSHGIKTIRKKGFDGTEESFKDLSGTDVSVIHLATHGFYFPAKEVQRIDYYQSQTYVSPMKRSGLMLTGGQTTWSGIKKIEQNRDGILTAEEISTMDLSNVSMVVLSACQTGLGDIDDGAEGVIGIQRAFKLAGVQSLLMSLWKVDDNATSYMMQTFYSKMLSGYTKHNALIMAQREVRNKYPNPFYWAGFVMLDGIN